MNEKMLRGNVTVLLAYPEAFADPSAPTAAELNNQFVYGSNEDAMVFNISCALLDDATTLNLTDSETDDTRTICDIGQVQNPTFQTYEVTLDALRDEDVAANGVYNLALELFMGVDNPFWAIKRIGGSNTTPFAAGDDIQMFGVSTDLPNDLVEDGALLKVGGRFKPNGDLLFNYRLTA